MIVNSSNLPPRPMRRRMRLAHFKQPRADIEENILPLDTAKRMYNCVVREGAIVSGHGINAAYYSSNDGNMYKLSIYMQNPVKTWQYHRYDHEKKVWDDRFVTTDGEEIVQIHMNKSPTEGSVTSSGLYQNYTDAINYHFEDRDVLVISSDIGVYILDDNQLTLIEESPKLVSICKHYERIFGVSGAISPRVYFSAPTRPDNWNVSLDEGGYIDLDVSYGKPYKVVSFLDYVYIFCEYGIFRLSAYTSQAEFTMRKVLVSSGKIYPDTIAVCGDRIVYCSEEGVFVFDGVGAYKVMESYDKLRAKKACFSQACYYDDKYVVTAQLYYGDGNSSENDNSIAPRVNSIILYDMRSKEVEIIKGVNVDNLICFQGVEGSKLYMYDRTPRGIARMDFCQLDDSGAMYGNSLEKKWESGQTDIGYPDKSKLLKSITLTPKTETRLILYLDGAQYIYVLKGGITRKIPINRRFEKISLEIRCYQSQMSITSPVLVIDYL